MVKEASLGLGGMSANSRTTSKLEGMSLLGTEKRLENKSNGEAKPLPNSDNVSEQNYEVPKKKPNVFTYFKYGANDRPK